MRPGGPGEQSRRQCMFICAGTLEGDSQEAPLDDTQSTFMRWSSSEMHWKVFIKLSWLGQGAVSSEQGQWKMISKQLCNAWWISSCSTKWKNSWLRKQIPLAVLSYLREKNVKFLLGNRNNFLIKFLSIHWKREALMRNYNLFHHLQLHF